MNLSTKIHLCLLSHSVPVPAAATAESGGYSKSSNSHPTKPRMPTCWWQELPPECEGQCEHPQLQWEFQKALQLQQPIHFTLEPPVRKDKISASFNSPMHQPVLAHLQHDFIQSELEKHKRPTVQSCNSSNFHSTDFFDSTGHPTP